MSAAKLTTTHGFIAQQGESGNWCTDWSTQFLNTNHGKYLTYAWTWSKKGNQSTILLIIIDMLWLHLQGQTSPGQHQSSNNINTDKGSALCSYFTSKHMFIVENISI